MALDELKNSLSIQSTHSISKSDELSKNGDPITQIALSAIESTDHTSTSSSFPHPAWEAVQAGLNQEMLRSRKIEELSRKTKTHLSYVDALLQMKAALIPLKDQTKISNDSINKMLKTLPESDQTAFQEALQGTLDKEAFKDLIQSKIDHYRHTIQMTHTTQMNPELTHIQTILGAVQKMIERFTRFTETVSKNTR